VLFTEEKLQKPTKPTETEEQKEKQQRQLLKPGQVPSFKQGIGKKIADKNGTDITTNILDMISYMEPKTTEELGKIIKSFKPHIKGTTLATYIRGYLNYLNISWRIDEKNLIKMPWAKVKVAPLDDSDVVKKENTTELKTITKEEEQEIKKERVLEAGEMAGKQAEWSDKIITDHSAAEVVSVYGGKVTERKLGMLLRTVMTNDNRVDREGLKDIVRMAVSDSVRNARYGIKQHLLKLSHGKYQVTEEGKTLLERLQETYDLDLPTPDAEHKTETKKDTRHVKKQKTRMRLLNNQLSKKFAKKYETRLYLDRYEDMLLILQKEGELLEGEIIDRLISIEGVSISRNNMYGHLRYGCERRDIALENKKYRLLPNAKRELEKIRKRREKSNTTKEVDNTETGEKELKETPMQEAKRIIAKVYRVDIDEEKYQKLKNTLNSAFGYKKSLKEFSDTKAWTRHIAAAYCRYGVRMGEITPVGKAPDGTTAYALVNNLDKLPRARKEIHIKKDSWVDTKEDASEGERKSKSYSIYEINKDDEKA
jgi:hypothetical protein